MKKFYFVDGELTRKGLMMNDNYNYRKEFIIVVDQLDLKRKANACPNG